MPSSASNPAEPPLAFMDVTEATGIDFVGTIDGRTLVRARQSAGSYLSQHDPRLHFGLGEHRRVAQLEVAWPNGSRRILTDIPGNRQVTVRQR